MTEQRIDDKTFSRMLAAAKPGATVVDDVLLACRARLEAAERERDENAARCEAFEDAVRENLPEVTCDSDGNLESNEVCRIETVGYLFDELERDRDRLAADVKKLRTALMTVAEKCTQTGCWRERGSGVMIHNVQCAMATLLADTAPATSGAENDAAPGEAAR